MAAGKISRGVSPVVPGGLTPGMRSSSSPAGPMKSPSPSSQLDTMKMGVQPIFEESEGEGREAQERHVQMLQYAASFLVDAPAAVPYKLPRHPTHLYHEQTDPVVKMTPQDVLNAVNKWQDSNPLVNAPFERVLRKLPPEIRPSSAGPTGGPLHHPNEPIWFEMVHRLHGILKRQGRRAERKRKRRLRSKLMHGRSKHASTKRDEGKELREYLDYHKAEVQNANLEQAAGMPRQPGEFLGKVHEQYLLQRERVESRPFRIRNVGTPIAGKKGVGDTFERKQAVVQPVYMPPPPSSMPRN